MGSVTSQEALSYSDFRYIVRNEDFDPSKGLAPIQMGDPKKMASEWHTKGKDSEFPCILLPLCLLSLSVCLRQIS